MAALNCLKKFESRFERKFEQLGLLHSFYEIFPAWLYFIVAATTLHQDIMESKAWAAKVVALYQDALKENKVTFF